MPINYARLFELLPLAVGAIKGDREGAAIMRGGLETARYLQQQRLFEQQLAEQEAVRRQQLALQQQNLLTDNERQARALKLQEDRAALDRLSRFYDEARARRAIVEEHAQYPLQAQNALTANLFGLAQEMQVPPTALVGLLPNMALHVSKGVKADAAALLEGVKKHLLTKSEDDAMDDASISFMWEAASPRLQKALRDRGHQEGQSVAPSQLRALFAPVIDPATGRPWQPKPKPKDEGVPTTERLSLKAWARERGKTVDQLSAQELLEFNKRFKQSDDRPPQVPTVVIQTVDAQGNPVTKIVPKTAGAEFAAPPTGGQRTQVAENEAAQAGLARIRELAPDAQSLARWVGPVLGRTNQIVLVTPGMAVDPQMAEFFAEVTAIKNRMIRAITGAQMSESEARRIMAQLPEVTNKPSVFLARVNATERNLAALNARIAAQSGRAPTSQRPVKDPLGIR